MGADEVQNQADVCLLITYSLITEIDLAGRKVARHA